MTLAREGSSPVLAVSDVFGSVFRTQNRLFVLKIIISAWFCGAVVDAAGKPAQSPPYLPSVPFMYLDGDHRMMD